MEINSKEFQSFLNLSETLTAFTSFQLQGTGQAEEYFLTIQKGIGKNILQELLVTFDKIKTEAQDDKILLDKALRHEILGHDKLGPFTRSIIKLWFVGTWYQLPDHWLEKYGSSSNQTTYVVSPNAYKEGLLWPTIGAHPMGAKAPGYGTWTAPPKIPKIN